MKNIFRISGVILLIVLIHSCKKDEPSPPLTVTDIDGNIYQTVTIGKQVWMKENLKTTKYRDGTDVPNVIEKSLWDNLTTPAFCWYNNEIANKTTYGALYNWYTINTGKICPDGWHVPTNVEFTTLATFLGGEDFAGIKLKEEGNIHWEKYYYYDVISTNESGFTGLPGGERFTSPFTFGGFGRFGYWWSSSEGRNSLVNPSQNLAHYRLLGYWIDDFSDHEDSKAFGLSIRCLKD